MREGQKICKEQGIEAIVAVGGGSTLDCSKAIACAAFYDGDPWDLWTGKAPIQKALPLLTVLTLSATGSEMDTGGVITNLETNDKLGAGAPILRPKVSILDPTYTYSVSKYQTAAGTSRYHKPCAGSIFLPGDRCLFAGSLLRSASQNSHSLWPHRHG